MYYLKSQSTAVQCRNNAHMGQQFWVMVTSSNRVEVKMWSLGFWTWHDCSSWIVYIYNCSPTINHHTTNIIIHIGSLQVSISVPEGWTPFFKKSICETSPIGVWAGLWPCVKAIVHDLDFFLLIKLFWPCVLWMGHFVYIHSRKFWPKRSNSNTVMWKN